MGRRAKPKPPEIASRLVAVKAMIADMADAMPTAARDLRRAATEEIEDLIGELR